VGDDRNLLSVAAEVGDERSQVRSHSFSVAQDRANEIARIGGSGSVSA
jgi:hypothetical protein